MTRGATDRDRLAAMRRQDPAPVRLLRAEIGAEELQGAMSVAIALGSAERQPTGAGDASAEASGSRALVDRSGRRRSTRGRGRPAAALAGLAVALLAGILVLAGSLGGRDAQRAYAAAEVEVAEANPRLLVTAPGWKVTHAGEFEPEEGESTFGNGTQTLTVDWYPARRYRSYLRDRADVSRPTRSRLLGRLATTVDYGRREYATMLAPIGQVFVEVRGRIGSRAAYWAILHSLRRVDVDAWLAAMPPSLVDPEARAATVERMLRGIPLPPGFDRGGLENGRAVLDHYALGARVADAAACGWVESWLAARKAGDAAAARAAVEAMSGSRRWPVLAQLEREVKGGWAHNVWHVAGELEAGRLNRGFDEALVRPDGSGYRLGPAWALGLECRPRIRRQPLKP